MEIRKTRNSRNSKYIVPYSTLPYLKLDLIDRTLDQLLLIKPLINCCQQKNVCIVNKRLQGSTVANVIEGLINYCRQKMI